MLLFLPKYLLMMTTKLVMCLRPQSDCDVCLSVSFFDWCDLETFSVCEERDASLACQVDCQRDVQPTIYPENRCVTAMSHDFSVTRLSIS